LTEINKAKDNENGIYIWLVHLMTFRRPLWHHLITSTFMCTFSRYECILYDGSIARLILNAEITWIYQDVLIFKLQITFQTSWPLYMSYSIKFFFDIDVLCKFFDGKLAP